MDTGSQRKGPASQKQITCGEVAHDLNGLNIVLLSTKIIVSLFYNTFLDSFILTLTRVKVRQSPHKLPCLLKVDYNININILLNLNITEKEGKPRKT